MPIATKKAERAIPLTVELMPFNRSMNHLASIQPNPEPMLFTARVFSRHPTHDAARDQVKLLFPCHINFGVTRQREGVYVELNNAESCQNSASKHRMKKCFNEAGVKTAPWWDWATLPPVDEIEFPIVAKHIMGSRGTGVYLIKAKVEFKAWIKKRERNRSGQLSRPECFIFEKFMKYPKEYRIHTWAEGAFYSCRKALKNATPKDDRWKFNHEQTVWLRETNANFKRPENWAEIEAECVKAIKACGLDFAGVDVKVKDNEFFIIEINSAPSFGDLTASHYIKMLPRIATKALFTKGFTWARGS